MFEKLALGAVAVAILMGARRFVTRAESTIARDFGERVMAAAASWLSGPASLGLDRTLAALRDVHLGKASPELTRLKRIDLEMEKRGPNDVALRVSVLWDAGGGNVKIGRIEESVAWEDVPAEARAAFIRGEHIVAYTWYESPLGG